MKRLLQFTGILTWVIGIAFLVVYLKDNCQIFNDFLRFLGLLSIVALISYSVFRLIWGDNWIIKGGKAFFIGNDLIKSLNQYLKDQPNPSNETTANLVGHLIYRITRLGIFGFLIGFLPAVLLWQQNNLFRYQNERIDEQTKLFQSQDSILKIQTNLFGEQNNSIVAQTGLLFSQDSLIRQQNSFASTQTNLFGNQNLQIEKQTKLVELQTIQIDSQINLLSIQNNLSIQEFKLMEAERHSSLIFLLSNVMDKLYEEIEEQREIFTTQGIQSYNMKFNVSPPLRGRIISLSRALKPYHILENGAPSEKKISPERGQILIALLNSQLIKGALQNMFSDGDFSYADLDFSSSSIANNMRIESQSLNLAMLQNAKLKNIYIHDTDCHEIQLDGAILQDVIFENSDLSGSNLSDTFLGADFNSCNLINANFTNSDLDKTTFVNSCLCGANFKKAKNIRVEQFRKARSLYGIENLPKEIKDKLDKRLFDKSKCSDMQCNF